MALARKWIPSPNYSSRNPAGVRLIIVHTAEGARTIESLGSFFQNPSSQVSSHTGIDDTPGTIGEYVKPEGNAWTAGNVNGVAVQVELCAFAAWDRAEWLRHPVMLESCRLWIGEEAARFNIPLVRLANPANNGRGVCGHVDVSGPGGHSDPGPAFPWDVVLSGAPATGTPPPAKPTPTPPPSSSGAPPFPGRILRNYCEGTDVQTWQRQMAARGWTIGVDAKYGKQSESVCRSFQSEKGLAVDGEVGPQTWAATWTAPVTP